MKKSSTELTVKTIGIDLGDKTHQVCMLSQDGQIVMEGKINNTRQALEKMFATLPAAVIALEAGTHSAWISSALEAWGHRVLVANPRKVKAISQSQQKNDQSDARLLAKLARVDPELLCPIRHRAATTQADQSLIKARHALLKARTGLINHCRGIVKSQGARLPSCSAECFHKLGAAVPPELREALEPLLRAIEETTTKMHQLERKIEALAAAKYPVAEKLAVIGGVGLLTALAFILVIEDPARFAKSRRVGAYLGLTPGQDQSGESDKQLRITKAGDGYLRMLLVLCAQHILGHRGAPSELREWGLNLAERGGKAAKKRAVVAVARRLAVQMHRLWLSEEGYDPYYATRKKAAAGDGVALAALPPPEVPQDKLLRRKQRARRTPVVAAGAAL
jgi:transposase